MCLQIVNYFAYSLLGGHGRNAGLGLLGHNPYNIPSAETGSESQFLRSML